MENAIQSVEKAAGHAAMQANPRDFRIARYRTRRLGDWASGDGNPFYDESFTWPDPYAAVRRPALVGQPEPMPEFTVWDGIVGQDFPTSKLGPGTARGTKTNPARYADPDPAIRPIPWPQPFGGDGQHRRPFRDWVNTIIFGLLTTWGFLWDNRNRLRNTLAGASIGVGVVYARGLAGSLWHD